MPDTTTGRFLLSTVVVAAVAAASVLLRALQLDEALSARVLWLAAIACAGGAGAAAVAALPLAIVRRGGQMPRALAGAAAVGLIFVPATLFAFAVKIRILDGRIEGDLADGIASGRIVFSMIGAMGMFTPTGLRYLAPWPTAAVMLAAGLAYWRWPAPRSLPETT